ncbi:MAG: hypothetical protein Q8910_00960 [Bacteroidota bacterium]|nr:hypothetical protein [Bacteroidota bacterium]
MSLDYTAKVSDIITALTDNLGMSSKADLITALSNVGQTGSMSDSMATLVGKVSSTMSKIGSGTVITPSTVDQSFPQGYYGGVLADGKVSGDGNLIPSNVAPNKSIFGVSGTYGTSNFMLSQLNAKQGILNSTSGSSATYTVQSSGSYPLPIGSTTTLRISNVGSNGYFINSSGASNYVSGALFSDTSIVSSNSSFLYSIMPYSGTLYMYQCNSSITINSITTGLSSSSYTPYAMTKGADGYTYVLYNTTTVQKWNALSLLSTITLGTSSSANSMCVDSSGNIYLIYVSSSGTTFVKKYNSSGILQSTYTGSMSITCNGTNLTTVLSGSYIYLIDSGRALVKLDINTMSAVWSCPLTNACTQISVDGLGNILCVSTSSIVFYIVDSNGNLIGDSISYNLPTCFGNTIYPYGACAFGSSGNLIFVGCDNYVLGKYGYNGYKLTYNTTITG